VISIFKSNSKTVIFALFLLMVVPQTATFAATNSSMTQGDYTIFYTAFTSDTIQPKMAKAYNIKRSKNRGLLSISIVKKTLSPSPMGTPVKAKVTAAATNLTGQLKDIDLRQIDEGTAVYYISEFPVAHKEVLDFTLKIIPDGESKPINVKFRQQFYTQ